MSLTGQLAAPTKDALQKGRFTLNRVYRCEASVAAPVSASNISYIQSVTLDPATFDETEIFHQGGGDESTTDRINYRWTGSINVLKGKAPYVLSQLRGITWDTGNDAAIPLRWDNDYPQVHWEAIVRKSDNTDHIFTLLIQDMVIDDPGFDNPLDYSDLTIPFHTKHMPLFVAEDAEVVYDEFSGDGSTTDFTLSSTPLNLATASSYEDLVLDNIVHCKVKASGESTGTRQTSGISVSGTTFTFTSAPAAGSTVQVLYVKATA
jgi:hypothetical protein